MAQSILLFDNKHVAQLYPLCYTRPIAALRMGIHTLKEKWELISDCQVAYCTADYLQNKFSGLESTNFCINAAYIADSMLWAKIQTLNPGEALVQNDELVAFNSSNFSNLKTIKKAIASENFEIQKELQGDFVAINYMWDLFLNNGNAIKADFALLKGQNQIDAHINDNQLFGKENIFIAENVEMKAVTINATEGPVYIGPNALIMEGALLRGPLAICENAVVKMGAKLYKDCTIGPFSKVGGELSNVILTAYSNKGHDGYLGNAVLGEWCNLGADTNNSNLKNNYDHIKIWSHETKSYQDSQLQFCGLFMGDHSKCAINTSFNTGTVCGVACNIYGSGFPKKFIPSFTWGGIQKSYPHRMDAVLDTAKKVMDRRKLDLSKEEIRILEHVYEITTEYRKRY